MVGEITPETQSIIDKYKISLEDVTKLTSLFGTTSKEVSDKLAAVWAKTSAAIKEATNKVQEFTAAGNVSNETYDTATNVLGTLLTVATKFDAFQNIAIKNSKSVNTMSESFNELTARFGSWEKAAIMVSPAINKLINETEGGAKKFFEMASSAQQLETAYMNMQGATGNMSNVFDEHNNIVTNLSAKVQQYGTHLVNTSAITGESLKITGEFASKLGTIPNVMNAMITSGKAGGETTDALTAAMTLARGAGRDNEEVLKAMSIAYEDLGNAQGQVTDNAQKGAAMFSLMAEASNKLGLRFEDTESYLTAIADEFKMVGDNTQGATNVLARFSGALQNTGLTAKSSVNIIQSMVKSMNNLEMGTKAMISARSGGPGGLQGAFQVEELLRKGKTDQVASMLEKSFKQQAGGKIYTQAEAAASPQAAAQFMRQREMLQSGAFGKMAPDDKSATRLLEAMAKGPSETANALKDALTATEDLTQKGANLQKEQVDVLKVINNSLDRAAVIANQTFLATARIALGTAGSKEGEGDLKGFILDAQQNLKNMQTPTAKAGEKQTATEQNRMAARHALVTAPKTIVANTRSMAQAAQERIRDSALKRNESVDQTTLREQERSTRATARGTVQPEKYMSLFRQPQQPHSSLSAQATAAQRTTRPTALGTHMMLAGAKATEQAPAKVELTVRLADGLTATQTTQSPHAIVKANPLSGGTNYTKYDPHNPGY